MCQNHICISLALYRAYIIRLGLWYFVRHIYLLIKFSIVRSSILLKFISATYFDGGFFACFRLAMAMRVGACVCVYVVGLTTFMEVD